MRNDGLKTPAVGDTVSYAPNQADVMGIVVRVEGCWAWVDYPRWKNVQEHIDNLWVYKFNPQTGRHFCPEA